MRKIALAALIAASTLAGCATTGGVPNINVQDVQNAALAACSFLPTASTVANIIAAGNPALQTAEAVAQAICAAVAVASPSGKLGGSIALPTVNGVVIHGTWVK